MGFDEWLEEGRRRGYCGALYCVLHAMPPREDLPADEDACITAVIVHETRFID
jgi:hypothetical protein